MLGYIYDFISLIFDKEPKNNVRKIILFGSFARGNARKDSDIDLFIDVDEKNQETVSSLVKESLNEFEIRSEKTWKMRGIQNPIAPIVGDLTSDQWEELRNEIAAYALVLYGKYEGIPKKNKHLALIEYDLSKTRQNEKMQFLRALLGYKSKKGKKIYAHPGLLERVKGRKVSSSLEIGIHDTQQVIALLKKHRIPYTIREIWH